MNWIQKTLQIVLKLCKIYQTLIKLSECHHPYPLQYSSLSDCLCACFVMLICFILIYINKKIFNKIISVYLNIKFYVCKLKLWVNLGIIYRVFLGSPCTHYIYVNNFMKTKFIWYAEKLIGLYAFRIDMHSRIDTSIFIRNILQTQTPIPNTLNRWLECNLAEWTD